MKKTVIMAAALLATFALTSCDKDAKHCYEITTTTTTEIGSETKEVKAIYQIYGTESDAEAYAKILKAGVSVPGASVEVKTSTHKTSRAQSECIKGEVKAK